MSIQDYLQMLAINPQPTPGPAPQPAPEVPHGTSFNVLAKGADTAINTARQALGMKEDKMRPYVGILNDALNASMAAHPDAISQSMAKSGFDPYAQQDKRVEENKKIVEYLQKAEQNRVHQELQQKQFEEEKRHHMATEGYRANKLQAKQAEQAPHTIQIGNKFLDSSRFTPIKGNAEFTRLQKAKSLHGNTLNSIKTAIKQLDTLDNLTKGHKMKPTDPLLGELSQKFTNIKASSGNQKAIAERNATKVLNDSLASLRVLLERAKKEGVPGEQMMKRFEAKGYLPQLGDSSSTLRAKLQAAEEEVSKLRDADIASMKYKLNIDAQDVEDAENEEQQGAASGSNANLGQLSADKGMTKEQKMQRLQQLEAEEAAEGQR